MSAEGSVSSKEPVEDRRNEDLELRARVDRSLRLPVLFFFVCAALWLLAGVSLGLLSALTLSLPGLFEWAPVLQYGRVQPAHLNALLYGWAFQAAFGTGYWLVARLGGAPLRNPARLLVGGLVWNLVVFLGVVAILSGWGTSMLWLDFPKAFWPVLLITYLLIMTGMVGLAAIRRNREGFISLWYVLAAAFWFPWVYATANGFIHAGAGAAVMKTAINSWYVSNVLYMVLVPMGVASAYYLVSKTTGRPVYSGRLAQLGFWSLALFSGWTGFSRYMGGPLPAWLPTVSGAAATFLLIPVVAVVANIWHTMRGRLGWIPFSPALRFTAFGMLALVVTAVLGALLAMIPTGSRLQFTFAHTYHDLLALYAFFSMSMFGAIYFIVPRVTECEWPHAGMIRLHFWLSVYGMVAFTFFAGAGLAQGHLQSQWAKDFLVSVERSRPYLAALALGWTLILGSNLLFVLQLGLMAIRRGRLTGEGPTLIHKRPEDYFQQQGIAGEGANA